MTIAKRLQLAMERRGFDSLRAFVRALPEGTKGGQYSSVHSYLKGRAGRDPSIPPLEFLLAASDLLGVRVEWLRDGEEPMTIPVHTPTFQEDEGQGETTLAHLLWEDCEGSLSEFKSEVFQVWFRAVGAWFLSQPEEDIRHFQDTVWSSKNPKDEFPSEYETLRSLGRWLLNLAIIPLGARKALHWVDSQVYFQAMFLSLQLAAPRPGEGKPLAEIMKTPPLPPLPFLPDVEE